MRFKTSLSILIILCIGIFTPAFIIAANDLESAIKNEKIDSAQEMHEVKEVIANCQVGEIFIANKDKFNRADLTNVQSTEELIYGEPYKVVVSDKALVDTLSNGKKISKLIKKMPYYWEVPVLLKSNPDKAIGSFTIDNYNGGWKVAEIGGYLPQEEIIFSSKTSKVEDAINENSIKSPQSIVHIRIPSIKTDYIYVDAEDQEFFLELGQKKSIEQTNSKEPRGYSERKVKKKSSQISSEIKNKFKKITSDTLEGGTGGETYLPDTTAHSNNIWKVFLLTLSLLTGAIFIIIYKTKSTRKSIL